MRYISEDEQIFIEELRKKGVLEEVGGHRLDLKCGVMSIICSDGDRAYDIFMHQAGIVREQCKDPRIHVFADNGGPLLLLPNSPIIPKGSTRARDLMRSIDGGYSLKQIPTVALIGHVPCGMADLNKVSLDRYIMLTLCGKMEIKTQLKRLGLKVACFLHIDYNGDKKRTYFLNKTRWAELFGHCPDKY